jgi:hypothetical protein
MGSYAGLASASRSLLGLGGRCDPAVLAVLAVTCPLRQSAQ